MWQHLAESRAGDEKGMVSVWDLLSLLDMAANKYSIVPMRHPFECANPRCVPSPLTTTCPNGERVCRRVIKFDASSDYASSQVAT
jgi:hypothetical protein